MSKAIPLAALLTALLVSTSPPAMAKGHSNGGLGKTAEHKSASASTKEKKKHSQHASKPPLKSNGGAGAGRPPGDTGNGGGGGAGKPPGDTNIGGTGAGKPPGDTGGAGAGKPPGDTNTGGAGAGRPAGDTGNNGGAGAGKS